MVLFQVSLSMRERMRDSDVSKCRLQRKYFRNKEGTRRYEFLVDKCDEFS